MIDLTEKYKTVAKLNDKVLIERKHTTKEEAEKDARMMRNSPFFDENKHKVVIQELK